MNPNDNNNNNNGSNNDYQQNRRTFSEEIEVAGSQLVDRIRELIQEGNVRRLIIRNQEGRTMLEIPLTIGAVAGGLVAFWNPVIAGVAVVGALVTKLKIEIVREEPAATGQDIEETAHKIKNDLTQQ